MRYLGMALFAEGPTDYRFLPPVLRRTTENLCLQRAITTIEVGEILPLFSPEKYRKADLETQILEAAREAQGAFDILFIHTDGAGDAAAAYAERVQRASERIAAEIQPPQQRTIGVVPVREMEAWTLVDGDALRRSFGTVLNDSALGIPAKPREVEKILDPKQTLNLVYRQVMGSRRRKNSKKVEEFFEAIAERVQLSCLRQVPAFQRFEQELSNVLVEQGYLKKMKE
ncbi:MAG: DUF4276 family protein [Chroococcales cyanobacterium]